MSLIVLKKTQHVTQALQDSHNKATATPAIQQRLCGARSVADYSTSRSQTLCGSYGMERRTWLMVPACWGLK